MALTKISELLPPLSFYKSTGVHPYDKNYLTEAGIKPGMAVYAVSATTVGKADKNGASPHMQLLGIAGWKRGHDVDTAYDTGTSIPVLFLTPGMIVPVFVDDANEARYPGHMYILGDADDGGFVQTTEDYTIGRGHGYLFEEIADDDLVAWMVII